MKHLHSYLCVVLGALALILGLAGAGVLALAAAAGCALMGGMMLESLLSETPHRHA